MIGRQYRNPRRSVIYVTANKRSSLCHKTRLQQGDGRLGMRPDQMSYAMMRSTHPSMRGKGVKEFYHDVDKENVAGSGMSLAGSGMSLAGEGMSLAGAGDPASELHKQFNKQVKKERKKKGFRHQAVSRDLGGQYKMSGAGVNKMKVHQFVLHKILPSLLKTVGIPRGVLKIEPVSELIEKALTKAKSGKIHDVVNHLTTTILPILVAGKTKHLYNKEVEMSGKGIGNILGKRKDSLIKSLGKGLFKAFKWYINNNLKHKGLTPVFKGGSLDLPGGSWGSFWKGFKKGFKAVFKPGAKILGAVASASGQPEIGVPLTTVSNLL